MRRPKRHQSKLQQRCEHLRAKVKWLSEKFICLVGKLAEARTGNAELAREIAIIKAKNQTAQKIIERAATIDFRRCQSGYYAIEVTFNGDFMGGISRHGQLQEFVAKHVAETIEHQIRSSKFIETAIARERREYQTRVRRAYQGGEWINDDETT